MSALTDIPVGDIVPNPEQPRQRIDQEKLDELAQSLRAQGLIQPIEVEACQEGGYLLHDGERRWRAAQMLGWKVIPAIVMPASNGRGVQTRLLRTLVANLQREDMNPVEEGQAYRRLRDEFGLSAIQLARMIGRSGQMIQNRLALTKLDEPIQGMISDGRLHSDITLARALLRIPGADARVKLAESLASRRISLKGCVVAAQRLEEALRDSAIAETPSIRLGAKRAHARCSERKPPKGWTIQEGLGLLPPWEIPSRAAVLTCESCELRDSASEQLCGRCPAVVLLGSMIRLAGRER